MAYRNKMCIWVLLLLLMTITFFCISCAESHSDDNQGEINDSIPKNEQLSETTMTQEDWLSLSGTPIELPDLEASETSDEKRGGDYPYFCGEVVEITEDYLVVKPDAALHEPRLDHLVSYAETLLVHSETYIVPRAMMGKAVIAADAFAVGDKVCVRFNDLQVYRTTEYDFAPVMRIIFFCSLMQSE